MDISVPAVADRIFEEIDELCNEAPQGSAPQMTDQHIEQLHLLFQATFTNALSIVDSGGVRIVTGERSGRKFFQVQGKKQGESYVCYPRHFCSCRSFYFDVVYHGGHYCKHQLAARLAEVLGRAPVLVLDDVIVANVLYQQIHAA